MKPRHPKVERFSWFCIICASRNASYSCRISLLRRFLVRPLSDGSVPLRWLFEFVERLWPVAWEYIGEELSFSSPLMGPLHIYWERHLALRSDFNLPVIMRGQRSPKSKDNISAHTVKMPTASANWQSSPVSGFVDNKYVHKNTRVLVKVTFLVVCWEGRGRRWQIALCSCLLFFRKKGSSKKR